MCKEFKQCICLGGWGRMGSDTEDQRDRTRGCALFGSSVHYAVVLWALRERQYYHLLGTMEILLALALLG